MKAPDPAAMVVAATAAGGAAPACERCPRRGGRFRQLGLSTDGFDRIVALAGNPNTGKSTVFNRLTGLRQHTGNWPGKTIARAEGGFVFGKTRYKLVDLPGTYSLLSASPDEEIARNFILFGRPDVTVIVADATALERNLNLTLQVLQITDAAVICLNMADEARAHHLAIDCRNLARDLGAPVVPCAARRGEGIPELLATIEGVANGDIRCRPRPLRLEIRALDEALDRLAAMLRDLQPGIPHARWLALRLLEGDRDIIDALAAGQLGQLAPAAGGGEPVSADPAPAAAAAADDSEPIGGNPVGR